LIIDLESDAAPDWFLLFGDIDHAAAALADLLEQPVTPDPVARLLRHGRHQGGTRVGGTPRDWPAGSPSIAREEVAGTIQGAQQTLNPLPQLGIASTGPGKVNLPFLPFEPEGGIEDRFQLVVRLAHTRLPE